MALVLTTPRDERTLLGSAERKCLVTGVVKPKAAMIRFVLDPSHNVTPDLAARLPGRGLWVSATRDALATAVKKNLFAKAAKTHAKADPNLPEQVEALIAKRCLELLGLARGAGAVVAGQMQVEQALRADELAYVLIAADAGADGTKKLVGCGAVPFEGRGCSSPLPVLRSFSEGGEGEVRRGGVQQSPSSGVQHEDAASRARLATEAGVCGAPPHPNPPPQAGGESRRAPLVPSAFTRDQFGAALGREHLVYIGLRPHSLTEKLRVELRRWNGVRASDIFTHDKGEE